MWIRLWWRSFEINRRGIYYYNKKVDNEAEIFDEEALKKLIL
jgi:hypothetical protein